jgi:pseudouridine-5'-monophosphatase
MKQNALQLTDVSHVIFDMDGLLLATEELYTEAANTVAKKFSRQDPVALVTWDLKVRQMGLQKEELSEIMVKELDLTCSPQQYLEETYKIHLQLFPKVGLLDGVERLIRHFSEANVPIALATSSSREYFELKTQTHTDLFNLFKHIVTGASDPEVKNGKPFPDINLVCAKR